MKKSEFEQLKKSVIEVGEVIHGQRKPSREFTYEIPARRKKPLKTYAVCIETDDAELLIPRKIYEITIGDNDLVRVVDEAGEAAIYPANFFMPISLSKDVETALAKIA